MNVLIAHVLSLIVLVPYLFVRNARCKKKERELVTKDGFNVTLEDLSTISDDIRFQLELNCIGVRQVRFFVYMSIFITFLNVIFMIGGFLGNAPSITFLGGLGISALLIWLTSEGQDEILVDIANLSNKLQLYADEEHQAHGRFVSDPVEYMILKENLSREKEVLLTIQRKLEKISKKKSELDQEETLTPSDVVAQAKLEKKWKKKTAKEASSQKNIEKVNLAIRDLLTDEVPSKWEHITRSFERKMLKEEIQRAWHQRQLVKEAEMLIQVAKQEI
ncbi:hypothetical protein [Rossellomorea marisflavi]|uniref:hypothetical protein n=1 Tax=Rossellomorea marisflavi TaxID=189381 RepID=UPI003FA0060F